ncbi:tetratricopeptide repeat protein [Cognataquiflexum rubidum]|uniref:tetratricopeptide repeat protein n=1 Tax=Cognataquiflexum rubidum TaxID=2922273 RepID=UPI001F1341BB|nr:tetratricopeptide repeat protein [Cognataquiflexum rubidum]MCH6236283.1 tetratricopeptide repeat protein [Cognataquiflexum rubidum]
MKLKNALFGLLTLGLVGMAQAQEFNWPSDPQLEVKAREYNAAYVDYMKSEQFVDATKPLNWLLVNTPKLNESIYINGVTIYNGAAAATTDAAQKRIYQDSVITIFDLRKENYDNETKWIENKAYYNYNYYKGDKAKLGQALGVFDRVVELNGTFNTINLVAAYFDLVYRHNAYNKAFTKVELLERYEKLNVLLAEAEANGKDISAPKSTLEQLVVAMELIDCEFIENTLGPRLTADPTNMVMAQKIFDYSVKYKCYGSNSFLAALEVIDNQKPTFATSQVRAMRYMQNREYEKALPVLEKALGLAENDVQKADVHYELAKVHALSGKKSSARTEALSAAKLDAEKAKEAWKLIAEMYMSSSADCRRGVSRVEDQAVYIAAYNAYSRAGDSKGMGEARARFPSREELFTESRQVGETITVGCWIGETVTLATRD